MASDEPPVDAVPLWTEGDPIALVTPDDPLVGLEVLVLEQWLENSPTLKRAYDASPASRSDIENAVRLRVTETFDRELQLRAQGMSQEEAEQHTRPAMWAPPIYSVPSRWRRPNERHHRPSA